jgi:hypothetical protein
MSTERGADLVAVALCFVGMAAGVVAVFYLPFLFAPIGLLLVLIAVVLSAGNRGLERVAVTVVALGAFVGAAIAVWNSSSLY